MAEIIVTDHWDRDDPRSIINLVPPVTADHLFHASSTVPELFGVDERTLYKRLKARKAIPTPTDNRLRIAFWMEFERSQMSGENINMTAVHSGVCTSAYFHSQYLGCAERVAWMVCKPASYEIYADEAINFGLEQLRDVLEIPHAQYSEDGKLLSVDTKLAEIKAKIVFGLEARRKGAVIQRVEQKNMNLNIATTDKKVAEVAMLGTMEDIDRRLHEIRKQQRRARAELEESIETTSVVVNTDSPGAMDE